MVLVIVMGMVAAVRTTLAAEGGTTAEAVGRWLQRKGVGDTITTTMVRASAATRDHDAGYDQRYAEDEGYDKVGWVKGWRMKDG